MAPILVVRLLALSMAILALESPSLEAQFPAYILVSSESSQPAHHPTLAFTTDGTLFVAWIKDQKELKIKQIYYSSSKDGLTFKQPEMISQGKNLESLSMAALDDTLYVVWEGVIDKNTEIFLTFSSNGFQFSDPINLSNSPSESREPAIAVSDVTKQIYVAWSEKIESQSDVIMLRFSQADLKQPTQLANEFKANLSNSALEESRFPTIAIDASENVYVAWQEGFTQSQVMVRQSSPFANPTLISAPAVAKLPHIAVVPFTLRELIVVWQQHAHPIAAVGEAVKSDIFVSRGTHIGISFSQPEFSMPFNISNTPEFDSKAPDIAVLVDSMNESGRGHENIGIVWAEDTLERDSISFRMSTRPFDAPRQFLANPTYQARRPKIVAHPIQNAFFIAWEEGDSLDNSAIYLIWQSSN